jgi:hypothetical protein
VACFIRIDYKAQEIPHRKRPPQADPIAGILRSKDNCANLNGFSIAAALQIHVHPVEPIPRHGRLSNMIAERMKVFSPVYSSWFGKPVVMLVLIRQCHVPMPCQIVGESAADVRVRIQPGWEMDVGKELILAVEEVVIAAEKTA